MNGNSAAKLDVPPEWEAAAAEILERGRCIVLLVGGAGVGKSSFCRYLAETLARRAEVDVIDADIGQANLGPPATISLARFSGSVEFRRRRRPPISLSEARIRWGASCPS